MLEVEKVAELVVRARGVGSGIFGDCDERGRSYNPLAITKVKKTLGQSVCFYGINNRN